jgi:TonB family protein
LPVGVVFMNDPRAVPSIERRFPRFPVAVPLDVVVLRSGIPWTIPGRSVDVGEGGVAAVLAGEVLPGEPVGVQFKLPFVIDPVHAKAQVRYYGPFRCGLQFMNMRPEQQGALHTWVRMAEEARRPQPHSEPQRKLPQPVSQRKSVLRSAPPAIPARGTEAQLRTTTPRARSRQWRSGWALFTLAIFLAAAVAVVWLPSDWWERYVSHKPAISSQPRTVRLAGSVVEQRLLHRVEPQYPAEAERLRLQGVVVLDTVIGTDGSVVQVRPLSGPDLLVQAASDAVRWWRFQPYVVSGQPVAVETTIEVDFQLPQ